MTGEIPEGCKKAFDISDTFDEAARQEEDKITAVFSSSIIKGHERNPICSNSIVRKMRDYGWIMSGAALQRDGDILRVWFTKREEVSSAE